MTALAMSGSLEGAVPLHNTLFSVEEWDGEKWAPSEELALFANTAFLGGEKLYHVHFHAPTNSVTYSFDKGAEHQSGRLFFTEDHLTFTGTITTLNNKRKMLRGNTAKTTYDTQRKKKSETEWSHWKTFSFETYWEGTTLKPKYHLGDEDITSRTAMIGRDKQWRTTISMGKSTNPILGGRDTFSIVIEMPPRSFAGTYTDESGTIYEWKGAQQPASVALTTANAAAFARFDKHPLRNSIGPSAFSSELRAGYERAPDLSVSDLMNVSCWVNTTVNGKETLLDTAQVETGKSFQLLLQDALDDRLAKDILGGKPVISDEGLRQVAIKNKAFFLSHANLNLGQMVHDGFKLEEKHKDLVAKVDMWEIDRRWKKVAQDAGYAEASSALYIQSYRLAVPGIQPYLSDPNKTAEQWGKELYENLVDEGNLSMWRIQISNLQFKNVKETIYEWHTKLSVLAPNQPYAKDMVNITFAQMLNAKVSDMHWLEEAFGPWIAKVIENGINGSKEDLAQMFKTNAEKWAEVLKYMVSQFGTVEVMADKFIGAMTTWGRMKGREVAAIDGVDEALPLLDNQEPGLWEKIQGQIKKEFPWIDDAKKVLGNIFKTVVYGAGAGFLIYQIVMGGSTVIDTVINGVNLGVMAFGLLVGGVESLFALKIGAFIEGALQGTTSGMGQFALSLTKWINGTEQGLPWLTRVFFSTSATDFIKFRIGPALALVGLVATGYQLYKAITSGDIRNIVFESINAFLGLAGAVTIGLEIFFAAWAGPLGLAIAIIGGLIALAQLIWNLVSPPTPPPDPIELFVKGQLTEEDLTKFPRKYTVKPGDTLTSIAKDFYGPRKRPVERLYMANRDIIGADRDKGVKPGQVWTIPHVVRYISTNEPYRVVAKKLYFPDREPSEAELSEKEALLYGDNCDPEQKGNPPGTEMLIWDVP